MNLAFRGIRFDLLILVALLVPAEALAQFRLVNGAQTVTQVTYNNPTGVLLSQSYILESVSGSALTFTATPASGGNWLSVKVHPSETTTGTTGDTVEIHVDPSMLTPGSYPGAVLFQQVGNPSMQLLIPVTLTLGAGSSGTSSSGYTISPTVINLLTSAQTQQLVTITPANPATSYVYSALAITNYGGAWLSVSPASSTTATSGAQSFTVSANGNGLTQGVLYSGVVRVFIGTELHDISVSFSPTGSSGTGAGITGFTISPTQVHLSSNQTAQTVTINPASSGTTFSYNTSVSTQTGQQWLSVFPQSGSSVVDAQSMTVIANTSGLTTGLTYLGTIRITINGATQDIAVTFTPGASGTTISGYTISPTVINLTSLQTQQAVTIVPTNTTTPFFFATSVFTISGGSWLIVTPPSSTSVTTGVQALTVIANPSGLTPGITYTGTVRVFIGTQQQDITVNMTPSGTAISGFTITPASITLSGGTQQQNVQIIPSSATAYTYTTQAVTVSGGNWLSVSPASATSPSGGIQNFAVIASPAGLTAGITYNGTVRVLINAQYQDIAVAFTPAGGGGISGYSIFPLVATLNTSTPSQMVTITPPTTTIQYSYSLFTSTNTGGAWLSTNPASPSGTLTGSQAFTIIANASGLTTGLTYSGTVRITINNQIQDITVNFSPGTTTGGVTGFTLSPTSINLNANQTTQLVSILPSGTGNYTYSATTVVHTGGTWLSVNPAMGSGTAAQTFAVTASPAGLTPGVTYTGMVRVFVNNMQQDIPVTFTPGGTTGTGSHVTPTSIAFEYTIGESPPPSQAVGITTTFATIFTASVQNDAIGFLRLFPTGGTTSPNTTIYLFVQPPALATPGTYSAQALIKVIGLPDVVVNVTLVVKAAPPRCTANPASVQLNSAQMQRTVRLTSGVTEARLYTVQVPPGGWLRTSDFGGTITGSKDITIFAADVTTLQLGRVYTANVHIEMTDRGCDIPVTYTTPQLLPLGIVTASLPGGIVATQYNWGLLAEGGTKPYTWSQTGLPDGVTLDAATGTISGFPTKSDTFTARITVRDSVNRMATVNFPIAIQPGSSPKLSFVPMKPCRVMETRAEYNHEGRTGAFGPSFLSGNETRTLTLPQSNVCQIPATAAAFVLNVTVIPRGSLDYVTVYAGDESRPELRTVSSLDGQIVANSAIVRAGSGGAIKVFASHSTDMLIDISGYFTSAPGLAYYPVSPCRAVETRIEYRPLAGPFGPPTLNTRETRRFHLPNSPYCSLPAGAAAYSATLTVLPQTTLPYLSAWPSGTAQPNVSSINSFAGRVLANQVIIPAGADGSIDVFAFERTDLLIDINGYFAPDDGTNGLFFVPMVPCRVTGANNSTFGNDTAQTIQMGTSTRCTYIPSSARAYALHATAIPGGFPMPFLTVYPAGQPRPNASVLNAFEGQTVTNSTIVPAGAGDAIDVYAFRATSVLLELIGYFTR